MATIGWIGLGLMGRPMSNHMRSAGHMVRSFDIDPDAQQRAHALGIQIVDSIAQACDGADAVFTMLPAGPDVKQVPTKEFIRQQLAAFAKFIALHGGKR